MTQAGAQPRMISEQPPTLPKTLGKTKVSTIVQKEILIEGKGFVDTYDWVINPYQGCSFGCQYCYASNFTQTTAEQVSWGQWVKVKQNAAENLRKRRKGALNRQTVYMATATDPYQPIERTAEVTKQILEDLAERQPGVKLVIQTRGPLVLRDVDLFRKIQDDGGRVQVNMTVTTDDDEIRKIYEPGCPSNQARLKAITEIQAAGVQGCITITPALPMKNPQEFGQSLLATEVKRFIIQGLHTADTSRGRNVAITDRRAMESAIKHYGAKSGQEAAKLYQEEYARNAKVIREVLTTEPGITLGVGKQGFKPPF